MTVFFYPLSTTEEWLLRKHVSYSNLPLTFADMNSKTNQLSQKSHQWSDDDVHWLHCELFQDFHHFGRLKVGQIFGWSSHDISPPLKREYHLYTSVLLKASCSIKTVSAADFPNRKQNFKHTLCSLLSATIKIAKLRKKATTTITVNLDWRHAADC